MSKSIVESEIIKLSGFEMVINRIYSDYLGRVIVSKVYVKYCILKPVNNLE